MIWLWLAIFVLLASFTLIVLTGAPYVPTLKRDYEKIIKLLALKPGEQLVDLGSGDGRILRLAARQGWLAVGYELNLCLAVISWLRLLPWRRQVRVRLKSLWQADLTACTGVFIFTAGPFAGRLGRKLASECQPGTKVVSHGFALPHLKELKHQGAFYLYEVPSRATM